MAQNGRTSDAKAAVGIHKKMRSSAPRGAPRSTRPHTVSRLRDDAAHALDSSFANGAGYTFRVNGLDIGRDSALHGAGFAVQFNDRFSTYSITTANSVRRTTSQPA
jgi:hypothetical protein